MRAFQLVLLTLLDLHGGTSATIVWAAPSSENPGLLQNSLESQRQQQQHEKVHVGCPLIWS